MIYFLLVLLAKVWKTVVNCMFYVRKWLLKLGLTLWRLKHCNRRKKPALTCISLDLECINNNTEQYLTRNCDCDFINVHGKVHSRKLTNDQYPILRDEERLALLARTQPLTQNMSTLEQRLQSFHRVPLHILSDKEKLKMAQAGFFYKGPDEYGECFHCGLAIRVWENDPIETHILYASTCQYLQCKLNLGIGED